MLRVYEIHYPELNIDIKFKILPIIDVDKIVERTTDEDEETVMRLTMEAVIQNLKTDVAQVLRDYPKDKAKKLLISLYNSCIMLNPGLDLNSWINISLAPIQVSDYVQNKLSTNKYKKTNIISTKTKRITRQKFLNLERHLESKVIGQTDAIEELVKTIKRAQAGLSDENRPMASFMFAGSSGTGKSYLAKVLQEYLFEDAELIRIDCGEYQQKHEVSKLIGAPPSYSGYEEGAFLKEALDKNPTTVFLIDEIEKAHPDIFNTFLPILDEGFMTDSHGNKLDFRNCIIIMTTNLGNKEVVNEIRSVGVGFTKRSSNIPSREYIVKHTKETIDKHFRPEFINRFDKIIVFNHLTNANYAQIAALELDKTNQKLEKRGCSLHFGAEVIDAMVTQGANHTQGARGLAQLRRDQIEDPLANMILSNRYSRGTVFELTHNANNFEFAVHKPITKRIESITPAI